MKHLLRRILPAAAAAVMVCSASAELVGEDYDLADLFTDAPASVQEQIISVTTEDDGTVVEEIEYTDYREADGSVVLTLTCAGDFTIGGDSRKNTSIWANELKKQGGDPNFCLANVKDILASDDLTLINFEGTLTGSTYVPSGKKNNSFLFSAPVSYASILPDNSVEAVSLENNHVMDHGQEAYSDTQHALEDAGVVWSNSEHVGVYEVKGVRIAMLSYLCIDRWDTLWTQVPADIAAAKAEYDAVIVSFHWGYEKDYAPRDNQIKMGRLAVDSGADLVLGHHSHRINPIEYYNGVYICYSLGNFCFAGNNKPDDMNSYLFQVKLRVKDGETTSDAFRIIPISISSSSTYNNFQPTVLTKETSIDAVMTTLLSNGKKLEYAVEEYPTEWE